MYIIIKAFLDDLIDFCYKGTVEPDMLAKYHKFYIKLTDKELKSKLGHYIFSKKAIHLFNVKSSNNVSCIVTLIHELSHHIDYINRGTSDHSKDFYNVHIELIVTLFKMGTVSYNEFINLKDNASNSNKLKRLVEKGYCVTEQLDYEKEKNWLIVKNCYEAYAYLKEKNYVYNFYIKSWMKKININDIEKYKGRDLWIPREEGSELSEDEYYIADLLGMTVVLEDGTEFGTLKDVMETGANDVYIIDSKDHGEVLLPAIKECILGVDIDKNIMTIHLMKGLV